MVGEEVVAQDVDEAVVGEDVETVNHPCKPTHQNTAIRTEHVVIPVGIAVIRKMATSGKPPLTKKMGGSTYYCEH